MRVRARNSDGWGNWSVVSTGTPLGTPEAPTGLSSVSGNSQLDISWSAPGNNGGYAISDYDIQYRALTGQTWGSWTDWQESTVSTSASTTINSGIVNDTTYQVRVRAVNSAGDGDWSGAVTDAAGKPSQPTIQLSTVRRPLPPGQTDRGGLLSITLSAVNNGSAVSDYDLRYRESGTSTWYTYRDRSHDTGRLSGSDTSSNTDPIDFGSFTSPSGAVGVARETLGSGYVYKFTKAVDVLWIRASGTITGGGTVYAHWHDSKPTAAQVATLGTQIFSATADSVSGAFWQDGWVTNLPANGYVWFYTADSETLTKRRLQLDFHRQLDQRRDGPDRPAQRLDLRTPGPRHQRAGHGRLERVRIGHGGRSDTAGCGHADTQTRVPGRLLGRARLRQRGGGHRLRRAVPRRIVGRVVVVDAHRRDPLDNDLGSDQQHRVPSPRPRQERARKQLLVGQRQGHAPPRRNPTRPTRPRSPPAGPR